MPLVSVIMPVRDGARHLRAALDSILGQTLRSLELLVVDDGSRDGTPAMLEAGATADPRLRVIRQDRLGIVPALQAGLLAARGDLVARMDADDVALPERLARQVEVLDRNPRAVLVGTACETVDDAGAPIGSMHFPTSAEAVREALTAGNCIAHPTVLMRRDPVLDLGGYRAPFTKAEDFDLWLRLSERHDLVNLDERLLRYRMHGGQSTWRGHEQRIVSEVAALRCARLRRAGLPEPRLPAGLVDLAFLRACGAGDDETAREIAIRAVASAEEAVRRGLWASAAGAVRLAIGRPAFGYRWHAAAAARLAGAVITRLRPGG